MYIYIFIKIKKKNLYRPKITVLDRPYKRCFFKLQFLRSILFHLNLKQAFINHKLKILRMVVTNDLSEPKVFSL